MTFTEAAVEVLRLVGKPLHYKKIAEIAIERNLLTHVGKTPEITMSSRLATMLKKDRGEAPIVKVKPGVFGLRDFPAEVLAAAERESGHDYKLPDDSGGGKSGGGKSNAGNGAGGDGAKADDQGKDKPVPKLPGAEVFPEEEDDDEPILAKLDKESDEGKDKGKSGSRKRRRRRRKKDDDEQQPSEPRSRQGRSKGRDRDPGGGGRSAGRGKRGGGRDREVRGDWDRLPADGEGLGRDLADAIESVLSGGKRDACGYTRIAEQLVSKGRLSGDPKSLVPTVAAAVRGDIASREASQRRPRLRVHDGLVSLVDWSLPNEAVKAEERANEAAKRQRDQIRRAFLRRISDLPPTGFMELIATWLNAEDVVALRGVRPPTASDNAFHLAGTVKRGPEETRVAIAIWRDGTNLGREQVIEVRGAMHHYGNASAVWLLTTGRVQSGAREEAATAGTAPCSLFDGIGLARAMERRGVGLRRVVVPVCAMDLDLLEGLTGPRDERAEAETQAGGDGERARKSRDRKPSEDDAGEEQAASSDDQTPDEAGAADDDAQAKGDDEGEDEGGGRRRRRRSRRGGRRRSKRSDTDEAAAGDESEPEAASEAEPEAASEAEPEAASEAEEGSGEGDEPSGGSAESPEPQAASTGEADSSKPSD